MKKEERMKLLENKLYEMQSFERELRETGITYIAGVDEVGRGPLAGPVVAAAVVLPDDFDVLGIDDSKKLSEKKREELFEIINEKALAIGIGQRDNKIIDEINILEATKEAMKDAIFACEAELKRKNREKKIIGQDKVTAFDEEPSCEVCIQHILFDAIKIEAVDKPQTSLIKGDARSVSIAASSIIAKVTRDRMMKEYALIYPDYGFETNKGYGTKAHYEGIEKAGITPIHRLSFLKNLNR